MTLRRKFLAGAAALALPVGLYAAAGYWIAPGYVRGALAELAQRRGLVVEVAAVRTRPFALRIELDGIGLSVPGGRSFAQAERATVDLAWASLWRPGWIVQQVRVDAPEVALGGLPGTNAVGAGEPVAVAVDSLIVEDGRLLYEPGDLVLEGLALRATDLSSTRSEAGSFEVSARLAGGPVMLNASAALVRREHGFALRDLSARASLGQGVLAAKGGIGFTPLEARLEVSADAVPLAQARRWLPPGWPRLVSGVLSGAGRLDASDGTIAYEGSARVGGLRIEERDSGALLLAWKEAATEALRFRSSPPAIAAGEIVVREPAGRLVIARDGTVNFAEVFGGEGRGRGDGEELTASFERLRVEQGTLHFADRSLATPFEATIGDLSGSVAGFSTAAAEPARVRLDGRVQPYGTARIRGTINLDAPATRADITARFRNLHLETFNPYVAKFAGRRIESGRLSAELRYQVRDGALAGSNQLVFENMRLGEKLEEKGLLELPLDLAVALLTDAQGRIDLAIPVRGNLNDPQFDLGAVVAHALGNAVQKVVAAPFRALASLFGGDGDRQPGAIGFAPGSARLSPPAEEAVARVAEALQRRPRLGVEVSGGYDPARDRQALGMRAAREAVASAAGASLPLDFSEARVVRAAEALFLRRGGDRATLRAMRAVGAPYGRLLLQSLAASAPAGEDAVQALARERAETVRAALLEHDLDPARVGLSAPQASTGAGEVAAALALRPAQELAAAAAGSSAPRGLSGR